MAYAQPFLRLVCSGSLYTTEQFSYGLTLINDFGAGEAPTEVPQSVITAVRTFHTAQSVSHQAAALNLIKLNLIGTDGRYVDQGETVLAELDPPAYGYATSNPLPQAAVAVSLRSAFNRGRAHAGRFYVPYSGAQLDNTGRMPTAERATLLAAATAFVQAINSAVPGWDVGIVSNIGTGTQRAVNFVRVGRVVDTMRSRRAALDEDYADGPLITEA